MIGPRPCAYPCAYVDPVFTSQSYDITISTSTENELVRFSCAYAYAYVDPVFTCLHMCLCLSRPSFHLLTHVLIFMLMCW